MAPDSPLFDWATFLTFVYLLLYAFAVLFIGISLYNLSAKRLRARKLPTGLAGLVPLAALFSGAAHWLQPRVGEYLSYWYVAGSTRCSSRRWSGRCGSWGSGRRWRLGGDSGSGALFAAV